MRSDAWGMGCGMIRRADLVGGTGMSGHPTRVRVAVMYAELTLACTRGDVYRWQSCFLQVVCMCIS